MKYVPKQPRKPCDNPDCSKDTPVSWPFCKDRKCQDARSRWRENPALEAALVNQAEQRAAMYRRSNEAHQIYLRVYRRAIRTQQRKTEHQVFLENSRLRQQLLEDALLMASEELRQLIEDQLADSDRVKRTKSDPWGLLSLDAPLSGADNLTLADLLEAS